MKTTKSLTSWAETASPGDSVVYAKDTGDLKPHSAALYEAWRLYEAGLVALVQRRERNGTLSYIAQRARPKPPAEAKRRYVRAR